MNKSELGAIKIDGQTVFVDEGHIERLEGSGRVVERDEVEMGYDESWREIGGGFVGVKYVNPLTDYSGYAEAGRNDVRALSRYYDNIVLESVKATGEHEVGGWLDFSYRGDYDIVILHLVPDSYLGRLESNKYHIARFVWETTRLPSEFVWALNRMDEVWAVDPLSKERFKASGVNVPIYVIPEVVYVPHGCDKLEIPGVYDDTYVFYSIFQWQERKNPWALLEAYWNEFSADDEVALVVKSYGADFSKDSKRKIVKQIYDWKGDRTDIAPVIFYQDYMTEAEIMGLHHRGDCYVQASKGEGWGIPLGVAIKFGNSVIYTRCGGLSSYLPKMVDGTMSNVTDPSMYHRNQQWFEVDVDGLSKIMRDRYNGLGNDFSAIVDSYCSIDVVASQMDDRIQDIRGGGLYG